MKKVILILFVLMLVACSQSYDAMDDKMMDDKMDDHMEDTMVDTMEGDVMVKDEMNDVMVANDHMMEDEMDDSMEVMYSGTVLAGEKTEFIDFNQMDYEKALSSGKTILLYFYANWCPTCEAELKNTYRAFNELDREDLVGFRVNYRDSDVDDYEESLAKKYGITYQHTKILLENGEQVLKDPSSWKKEKYLEVLEG